MRLPEISESKALGTSMRRYIGDPIDNNISAVSVFITQTHFIANNKTLVLALLSDCYRIIDCNFDFITSFDQGSYGGAVYAHSAELEVNQSAFSRCTATCGGAICSYKSIVSSCRSRYIGNSANLTGSHVDSAYSNLVFNEDIFKAGESLRGAFNGDIGDAILKFTNITDNRAHGNGCGVSITKTIGTISYAIIIGNIVPPTFHGGAVLCYDGKGTIDNSIIMNNGPEGKEDPFAVASDGFLMVKDSCIPNSLDILSGIQNVRVQNITTWDTCLILKKEHQKVNEMVTIRITAPSSLSSPSFWIGVFILCVMAIAMLMSVKMAKRINV